MVRRGSQLVQWGEELVDPFSDDRMQMRGEAIPVLLRRRLSRWQSGECFPDLGDGEARALGCTDHGDPAAGVREEAAVVVADPFAGQQAVVVVPAHSGRSNVHPFGELPDAQPALVQTHASTFALRPACLQPWLKE